MSSRGLSMNVEPLSRTEASWRRLFDVSPDATPFSSFEWFQSLTRHLLKDDPPVLIFSQDKTVVGIIPAWVQGRTLKLIGDDRVTDLNDMLYVRGYEHAIVECFLEYSAKHALKIDLYPLERSSPLATLWGQYEKRIKAVRMDTCPLLKLAQTWEEYLNGLTSKARHELRRKMKKVNGAFLRDVKLEDMDTLFKLMARSVREKASFLTEDTMGFFRDIAASFNDRRWLRLRVAVFSGSVLGMIFAFVFGDRIFLFNMGFAPELRHLSPGIVTVALDIQSAIAQGYGFYDFLRGDEKYKYGLGAIKRDTVRITA